MFPIVVLPYCYAPCQEPADEQSASPVFGASLARALKPRAAALPDKRYPEFAFHRNRMTGIIRFTRPLGDMHNLTVEIYDAGGGKIARLTPASTGDYVPWNTSGIRPGVYFFRVLICETESAQETLSPTP